MIEDVRTGHQPQAPSFLPLRLATLLAAQFFDFGTFSVLVWHQGIQAEANPIVVSGYIDFGWPMVTVVKIVLAVLVGSVIVILDRRDRVRGASFGLSAIVALVGVLAGLTGGLSNVTPLLIGL